MTTDIPFYSRWTVDELKDMIALLKCADFDPSEIDTDLHKRVTDAIQDGYIKRFDMHVKADPKRGWTQAELNGILQRHVVRDRNGCTLTTFGCVEWESELYRGVMRARCYPVSYTHLTLPTILRV